MQQDVAPPVIEVPESPPPVAVCRAAEEAANLEDVTIMEQAPAAGKMTGDLLQPPPHIAPPGIDTLGNDDDQYMVPDDHDEFLDFSAEDSHPDDLASAPDDNDDDNSSHAMPESRDSGPADEHMMAHEGKPPVARSSMPLWLLSNYRDLCESLRAEMNQNESCQPSAYNAGQFLLPPKNPLFTAAHSNHLSLRLFYEPHYYLWLPHLFNRIPCPACKAAKRTNNNGSAVTLRLHGWPQAPQ